MTNSISMLALDKKKMIKTAIINSDFYLSFKIVIENSRFSHFC